MVQILMTFVIFVFSTGLSWADESIGGLKVRLEAKGDKQSGYFLHPVMSNLTNEIQCVNVFPSQLKRRLLIKNVHQEVFIKDIPEPALGRSIGPKDILCLEPDQSAELQEIPLAGVLPDESAKGGQSAQIMVEYFFIEPINQPPDFSVSPSVLNDKVSSEELTIPVDALE